MGSPVVDVQQHFVPTVLARQLEAVDPAKARYITRNADTLEERISEMDHAGIDFALVSLPKLPTYSDEPTAQNIDLVRRCNDELLSAVARHSDRFGAWIALPFPSVSACLDELDRLGRDPLVRGVEVFAATDYWPPDDSRFDEVYAAIASSERLMMVHPADDAITRLRVFDSWTLSASIAPMIETSAAVARLILSGTLDRVEDLTVLVPHLGGVLPYLLQRIADQSGRGAAAHDFAHYFQHRLVTDTCSFHAPAFNCAVAAFTSERLVLGSDWPYRGSLARLLADEGLMGLAPNERIAVTAGNAARLGLGPA